MSLRNITQIQWLWCQCTDGRLQMPLVGWPMRCTILAVKAIFCETVSIQLVGKLQRCMKTQILYKTVYKSTGLLYKISVGNWEPVANLCYWCISESGAEEDLCAVSGGQTEFHVIKMKLISLKLANWTNLMLSVNAEQSPNDSVHNPRPSWAFPCCHYCPWQATM